MNATQILKKYKKRVWPVVNRYLNNPNFPKAFLISKKYQKDLDFFWKTVRDYPERKGKYLRPTLVCLTAESMGIPSKKALTVAAGMQLSEEWLLIHDDFEDGSSERRGQPALQKIYGNELAVNAGDALHNIMWKTFFDAKKDIGDKKTNLILNEFYLQLSRTIAGQGTEIAWTRKNKLNFNDQDWYFLADGKTSYYTIACPMRLGAIIAGANKRQLDQLAEFGLLLGRCFQLVDDILDLTSDFDGLKKQTGNDIYEGKRTIIFGHLLKSVKGKDKKKLLSILNKSRDKKSTKEISWVISKMHEYGSITYAKKLANYFRNKAYDYFEKNLTFLSHQPARNQLKILINFVLERDH